MSFENFNTTLMLARGAGVARFRGRGVPSFS
jgi:hypothetical protein